MQGALRSSAVCRHSLMVAICRGSHGVDLHIYADDAQIYWCFRVRGGDIQRIRLKQVESGISDIRTWMLHNKLLLNASETEFQVVVSPRLERQVRISGLQIGDALIVPIPRARNLEVIF